MKVKYMFLPIFILLIALLFSGCTPDNTALTQKISSLESELSSSKIQINFLTESASEKDKMINELKNDVNELQVQFESSQTQSGPVLGNSLINEALTVVSLLANQDAAGLDLYVSPTKGVRFTPYFNVDINNNIVFNAGGSILNMFTDNTVYVWGNYDGSGEPITFKPSDYYSEFIYDHDFQNPNLIGINTFIGTGNIVNNIASTYPIASFVEFHFSGFDPQYGGMDWSSLVLVFENDNGIWHLVGIIHGQWTT